ncbi:MAG: hypothetical protein IT427_08630 [Pirellulales bacterium]|nr:hypothetical protein [Pirellulales bacterium]
MSKTRKLKRSQASLTGGIIVGVGVLVLSMLITGELLWSEPARWLVSILFAVGLGSWVRVADL